MKTLLKIVGYLILAVVVLLLGGLTFLFVKFPKKEPAPDVKVEITPGRVQRGEYLARHVTGCIHCHSDRDDTIYSSPSVPGMEGRGSVFLEAPELGRVSTPNITPARLAEWTDGEIIRAMTSGVSRDGRPLFAIMPYSRYSHLTREDGYAIIAFIRSLKPQQSNVPPTELKFPLNLIVRTMPQPGHFQTSSVVDKGEYLATVASCAFCHTPVDDHEQSIESMKFAGGHNFGTPGHPVRSVNITPDPETGIGNWTKEQFITKFKRFDTPEARGIRVEKGQPNTVMPWIEFSGMTEEDLGAIYDYLMKQKPIHNKVERFGG